MKGYCCHSKSLILHVHYMCFGFYLLCSKQETIHSNRNLEMAYCTAWHFYQKLQYKDYREFRCQSENRFIFLLMKSRHPIHMVVTNHGDIMLSFIIPHGLRLNMEVYIKWLEEIVLPWIKRVTAERSYIWQH